MNFYKRFHQRDTGHLSMTEHGAYTLLLGAFYATGQPLPLAQKVMHRLVRAISGDERAAVDAVLDRDRRRLGQWTGQSSGLAAKLGECFDLCVLLRNRIHDPPNRHA